jgi:hypothetical protein
MSTINKKNFNISKINGLTDTNDSLSSVTINNSIKIPKSSITTNSISDNSNAGILIKDVNSTGSGDFYNIKVDSFETDVPQLYFNTNLVIDSSNLLSEFETILVNYPLETSNIIVEGGYINFFNGTTPNTNKGETGVGLRYSNSNNTVQFKNYDTDWIDLVDITKHDQFSELNDVDVYGNTLLNNQYITYNSTANLFVNSNLEIINDISPKLGGNLKIGSNLLQFGSSSNRLVYNSEDTPEYIIDNNLLVLTNNTTETGVSNYIEINNANTGNNPSIIAKSTSNFDTDVSLDINTTGTGYINLNAQQGNIYANSDSLIVSGFVTNSIFKTSTKEEGEYIPDTPYTIPLTNDTILFDFVNSSQTGTYWANVGAGFNEGQKLNLIYNNKGSNVISVLVNFGTNGVISESGFSNGFVFTATGQSSSLVYLGSGIDAWQILNTGYNSTF